MKEGRRDGEKKVLEEKRVMERSAGRIEGRYSWQRWFWKEKKKKLEKEQRLCLETNQLKNKSLKALQLE